MENIYAHVSASIQHSLLKLIAYCQHYLCHCWQLVLLFEDASWFNIPHIGFPAITRPVYGQEIGSQHVTTTASWHFMARWCAKTWSSGRIFAIKLVRELRRAMKPWLWSESSQHLMDYEHECAITNWFFQRDEIDWSACDRSWLDKSLKRSDGLPLLDATVWVVHRGSELGDLQYPSCVAKSWWQSWSRIEMATQCRT